MKRAAVMAITLAGATLAACAPRQQVVRLNGADGRPWVVAADLSQRLKQFPAIAISHDDRLLAEADRAVVKKLIEAAAILDGIFLRQVSENNATLASGLEALASQGDPNARAARDYFRVQYGPWDRLQGDAPFIGTSPKPLGAGFYPDDLTRGELERWLELYPEDTAAITGLFTVVRRKPGGGLQAIPYSQIYGAELKEAAVKLREAAALTRDKSLARYLETRAAAFLSDSYFESDVAWMDLDSDVEPVLGPYEVYEDKLFGYKAAFEAFITVRDPIESAKLAIYAQHLPAMERNLPIPDEHKNPNRGSESPVRVVQLIYSAGDTRAGVQTAAFNLPNDEKVREAKGSKKVLLKNVMEAKFRESGLPIAERLAALDQKASLSFDAYFNFILFHELSHGLGPGIIKGQDGAPVDNRLLLKDLYPMIEECKADVLGVWNILYAMRAKLLEGFGTDELFVTYAGLMFRSMRFGLGEAHGGGTAIQWSWLRERGVIVPVADGRFRVDIAKAEEALGALAHELLMIQATGDYDRAQKLLARHGQGSREIEQVIDRLSDIPVDLRPIYIAAGEVVPN